MDLLIDSKGDTWITGWTRSIDFPLTNHSKYEGHNTKSNETGGDAFILCVGKEGQKILHSTLFGGKDQDLGISLFLDSEDNVLVTGCTFSEDLQISHDSFKQKKAGDADIFVLKMDHSLTKVFFCSYFGGGDTDYVIGGCLTSSEDLILGGYSKSFDFLTTPSALKYDKASEKASILFKIHIDYCLPSAPDQFLLQINGEDMLFSWNYSQTGEAEIAGYNIYSKKNDADLELLAFVDATQRNYQVKAPLLQDCYYYIKAVDINNKESMFSSEVVYRSSEKVTQKNNLIEYFSIKDIPDHTVLIDTLASQYNSEHFFSIKYLPYLEQSTKQIEYRKVFYKDYQDSWGKINGQYWIDLSNLEKTQDYLDNLSNITSSFQIEITKNIFKGEVKHDNLEINIHKLSGYENLYLKTFFVLCQKSRNSWEAIEIYQNKADGFDTLLLGGTTHSNKILLQDFKCLSQAKNSDDYSVLVLLQNPISYEIIQCQQISLGEK
jgi:hypothetical protein